MDSGMFIFNSDNKIMGIGKRLVAEGHSERIELYTERYALSLDIFSGEPLEGVDFEQREKAESRKSRAESYGFGHTNGFNKHIY